MYRDLGSAEVVVVGSGLAGACVARRAAERGRRVVVIERGQWMSSREVVTIHRARTLRRSTAVPRVTVTRVHGDRPIADRLVPVAVGGLANFYAGVSLRIRPRELERWPTDADRLARCYDDAEALLAVAGTPGGDPLPPPSALACRFAAAADRLGMQAMANPLAIRFGACRRCVHCNQVPCPFDAKFSPARLLKEHAIAVLPGLQARELVFDGARVVGVDVTDADGRRGRVRCEDAVVVCAGALESPRLLERSGLGARLPHLGRNLMTHVLADIGGLFREPVGEDRDFEKWLSFDAGYFDADGSVIGLLQQEQPPPLVGKLERTPAPLRGVVRYQHAHTASLIAIAEDDPKPENMVATGADGRALVRQRYTRADEARRARLVQHGRKLLRAAGAYATWASKAHSVYHACGTARMGRSERDSVTDASGRVWGADNLFVGDASLFPTSSGVNPSLTIAALALHVAGAL